MSADIKALQQQFSGAGFLSFTDVNGLCRIDITTKSATTTVFLQGAHLTAWQPAGEAPVIFLSHQTELAPSKPLRGGIPIVFPWFAGDKKSDRIDGHPGPSHGFARIEEWTLQTAVEGGGDVELLFSLGPTALSRSMGFDRFELSLQMVIGRELSLTLKVNNVGGEPIDFEEAFHTYLQVADIHEVQISGLESNGYIDKTDHFLRKPAEHAPLRFFKTTDRVYENASGACRVQDGAGKRTVTLHKTGSDSTVVWNPFQALPDLGDWDWHDMVAVETANVAGNHITLAPGASKEMGMTLSVQRMRT